MTGTAHAHVANDGQAALCKRLPVRLCAVGGVRGNQGHPTRYGAMRQRQPQGTANGQSGGDSADAIDGYAAFAQPGHFFAASPKDERVAAFQASPGMALACIAYHESTD